MSEKSMVNCVKENFLSNWDNIGKFRKPLIAAINGYALGGGCELAMMCDIIYAGEDAKFGQPEIKIGTIPGGGGTQRLIRAVGKSRAMEMILSGKVIGAKEAEDWGLVARVFPKESLSAEVLKISEEMAKLPSISLEFAKEAVNKAFEMPLASGLEYERRLFHLTFGTVFEYELLIFRRIKMKGWPPLRRRGLLVSRTNKSFVALFRANAGADLRMFSETYKVISEGAAKVFLPEGQVFYNPVQVFNRDLSVMAIRQYCIMSPKRADRTALEALSATGLRAVRYAKECPEVSKIIANDIDRDAVELIRKNVSENDCADRVSISQGDANLIMIQFAANKNYIDIIDLDPYGTAAPFLDSAMQSIADGGLLCVTCTDMAALCASYSDACLARYGSIPVKGDICHEFAIRIILNTIERAAARFRKSIEPLMSCAIDFYSRIFVKVHCSNGERLRSAPFNSGYLLRCPECRFFNTQPICRSLAKNERSFKIGPSPFSMNSACDFCKGNLQLAGPFWTGQLHDPLFLDGILRANIPESISTGDRIRGLLAVCKEEYSFPPLYYSVSEFAHTLRSPSPSLNSILYAIKNSGYDAAISHTSPLGVKTNAPFGFMLSIFKAFLSSEKYKFDDGTDSLKCRIWRSFDQSPFSSHSICFEKNEVAIPSSKKLRAVRFPPNPEKNWGPKPRAKPLSNLKSGENK